MGAIVAPAARVARRACVGIGHTAAVANGEGPTRVALLAPMEIELAPLVAGLGLEDADGVHRGRVGGVEVLALLTTIGMAAGSAAAERALGLGADHVIVVGVAGGVDPRLGIGDVFVPERVVDRAAGTEHRPAYVSEHEPRGTLSCGDDLLLDEAVLAELAADGVVALDMETAAVAAVCEAAGVPWSVFRSPSDRAGEGLVDPSLFALTNADGTMDPDALTRWIDEDPNRVEVLARLANDAQAAAVAAAEAAVRAVQSLAR
jgi:adenosylhomocysteine nucleosidase